MKNEFWTMVSIAVFFVIVTPAYWVIANDVTGTVALTMTLLLALMMGGYLGFVAKEIPDRPEDRKDGEIADGAGELGFFPPFSWWPLWCALAFSLVVLGIVFGWWLFIMALPLGAMAIIGWVFEFYRGIHAH